MRETERIARREIAIHAARVALPGSLDLPSEAQGVIVFAHGSGSSRLSPRNLEVASALNEVRLGTLLFDLLTPGEAADRRNVFDIPLLAERLEAATAWLEAEPELGHLPIGYFGASTGAGAALWAAAGSPHSASRSIAAVVSRGGRPDLAEPKLAEVRAPTLLIVGSRDTVVLGLNEAALALLTCEAELRTVEGATHLFEEPGTLDEVAVLAREWFSRHLAATS